MIDVSKTVIIIQYFKVIDKTTQIILGCLNYVNFYYPN